MEMQCCNSSRLQNWICNTFQEGWVTVAGNQGTIFLQEGGHLWKVGLVGLGSWNSTRGKDSCYRL